jgi:hypothetical protein
MRQIRSNVIMLRNVTTELHLELLKALFVALEDEQGN